ncbi:MAG: hypothetical protein FGM46_07285 [Ferruginibacter sp.]|nr:hypothetical protein [Ferruginibacter sp.]
MTIQHKSAFDFTQKTVFLLLLFVFNLLCINDSSGQKRFKKRTIRNSNNKRVWRPPPPSMVAPAPYDTLSNNEDDENKIFTKVDVDASFPGDLVGWQKYLQSALDATIPAKYGAPPGSYTVIIRFIVDKDGSVSDVFSETAHGYGMETESIRVIRNSGKWTPAIQNGRNVTAYKRQPITWMVSF